MWVVWLGSQCLHSVIHSRVIRDDAGKFSFGVFAAMGTRLVVNK